MKRIGTSFGSAEPQEPGTVFPSLFEHYNLNHLSVFSVTLRLRLSCLPLACLHSRTLALADTTLIQGRVLAYQQYIISYILIYIYIYIYICMYNIL
jgi:hypothetical protein